jgi:hypothetical protein
VTRADQHDLDAATAPTLVPLPRWVAKVCLLFSVVLIPWIAWLAVSLPQRHVSPHYDLTWVGFDIGLLGALSALAILARRRSTYVELAASAAGTMLLADAWFDITSSSPGRDMWQSVAIAAFVEVPVAIFCWWIARNAELIRRRSTRRR